MTQHRFSWYPYRNIQPCGAGYDSEYIPRAAGIVLGDLSGVSRIYLITGRTDMRLSINGLMAIIRNTYQMDPYANALYLFCGRKQDRLKALHHDKTGFVLLYMGLDSGRFQWPRNASEVRALTLQEYRWLIEGLSIDQPRALHPVLNRDF